MVLLPKKNASSRRALRKASLMEIGVEVRAIECSNGRLKDEIIISMPLVAAIEKELDEDPLYYYPPSTPKDKQVQQDEVDTESESDSDEDEDDEFDQNGSVRIISNPHQRNSIRTLRRGSVEEYCVMDELLQTLDTIFGCSYSGCPESNSGKVPKSILRKKGSPDYSPPIRRNVSFTRLEIREFNMTLGNHPSAVSGPPVMLDWDAQPTREAIVDLETYERARQPRRSRKELKLSFEARRGILEKERGFTVEEVKKAWSEALHIRKQRYETRMQAPHQRLMDEIYESAMRKYNRLLEWKVCS